nr:pyridoxal-dependent decarboxylase [Conexibacter sp. SYSU D00693]
MSASPASRPRFAPPALLGSHSAEHYLRAVTRGADRVASTVQAVDAPFSGATPDDLEPAVAAVDLDRPVRSLDAALDEVERLYLRDAVWFHHPRYLAHLNCPVAIPALLAETILAPVNSSLDTWDQSAGATLIERRLVDWAAARAGFGEAADGIFTSGGSQSNLQGLHLARDEALAAGWHLGRLRVLVSEVGHFSVAKSADLLGLGKHAVVPVACDDAFRMDPAALREELERCARYGLHPMAVVATAGTTDFGSIDPLHEVADACADAGTWLHVDAAYGCGLLVSPRRRALLDGVERADSVTVDFHKSFFQPISSSALLVRDGAKLGHVTHHADYLNPASAQVPNQVDKSLQTTRRFDALKLWLTLRTLGAEGVGELFDQVCDLAREGHALLADDPRFDVAVAPALSTLVFRVRGADDAAQRHAREALMAAGAAVVAATTVGGGQWLKLTLLNPQTTVDDLAEVLDLVAQEAAAFAGHGAAAVEEVAA